MNQFYSLKQAMELSLASFHFSNAEHKESNSHAKVSYAWEGKTILVAEDEEFNYLYLKEILEPTMVTVLWAMDGQLAVELCRKVHFDAILMDIKMPRMNGLEATKQIRSFNREVPVIAQTAYTLVDDQEKCMKAGCSCYLAKPISSKVLLSILDEYFKK